MPMPHELVESFYNDAWNRRDEDQARRILAPDLEFRGSLDDIRSGVNGFLDYARLINAAFDEFSCTIAELIAEGEHVATRMVFSGIHRAPIYGVPPSGKRIEYAGAAFFTTGNGLIRRVWVLGDVDGVKKQLGIAAGTWTA